MIFKHKQLQFSNTKSSYNLLLPSITNLLETSVAFDTIKSVVASCKITVKIKTNKRPTETKQIEEEDFDLIHNLIWKAYRAE